MTELNTVYLPLVTLLGTLVIVSLGILINNSRMSDLRALIQSNHANMRTSMEELREEVHASIRDLRDVIDARFAEQKAELFRVEQVMDARLKHLEENL